MSQVQNLRTVYLGTSDFAAVVLRRLTASPHRPALVVTRPARPKGRGRELQDPPVAELARELGIEVFQPESVNEHDAVERIRASGAEAIVVCAFGALVKEPLLSMLPIFNVHPSLLPRWRGAAPIERAIAAGDDESGVSVMRLEEELDAGPVCVQATADLGSEDDYGSLAPRLAELGGELLVVALDANARGDVKWTEQVDLGVLNEITYAEKITADDRRLNPSSEPALKLERMIRALSPHIGAYLKTEGGDPLRVERARAVDVELPAGTVTERDGRLLVGTSEGSLELLRVKPAGGKAMDVESFLRGNDVPRLAV